MRFADNHTDPDDLFSNTRMSFGEHIDDLRTHMLRALGGFLVAVVFSFFIGRYVLDFIKAPVEAQWAEFIAHRDRKVAAEVEESLKQGSREVTAINDKVQTLRVQMRRIDDENEQEWKPMEIRIEPVAWALAQAEAQRLVNRANQLRTMSITEGFMVWAKVCMVCGLVLGSPWIFYQIWAFVAAGLYPHEKQYVHVYLPFSLGLFLAGVFMCQFLVIPKAVQALLMFNEWLGLEPELRLNEWLSFALLLPLVFGLSFQTPLVMLFLAKIGILDVESFRSKRRIAWFAMAAFAAVITPIDALSMILLWIPMCGLYELGILLVQYSAKPSELEDEASELGEMVEV
jgi:sec-independent protein translocase protein TatC